jgi:hypothetical protein
MHGIYHSGRFQFRISPEMSTNGFVTYFRKFPHNCVRRFHISFSLFFSVPLLSPKSLGFSVGYIYNFIWHTIVQLLPRGSFVSSNISMTIQDKLFTPNLLISHLLYLFYSILFYLKYALLIINYMNKCQI